MEKYVLISVSDKTGIVAFAKSLVSFGYKIISTGGTSKELRLNDIPVVDVSDLTGFEEVLNGRVKTLHPLVHGSILYIRNDSFHLNTKNKLGLKNIDLVVVNLYPFEKTASNPHSSFHEIVENIDIGGPAMIRSAAKNYKDVTVVVHPSDYNLVSEKLQKGEITTSDRLDFACKAFSHTALYDSMISNYLNGMNEVKFPQEYTIGGRLNKTLRYGENPHQDAGFYTIPLLNGIQDFTQLNGKDLSFNNLLDINSAISLVNEFILPACVIVKHTNPCGVAVGSTAYNAFTKAFSTDNQSAFGGIVAFNREVDITTAELLHDIFLEVIIAPSFSEEALICLKSKKNIRLLSKQNLLRSKNLMSSCKLNFIQVEGGFLTQNPDDKLFSDESDFIVPTKKSPTLTQKEDLIFAWTVAKHVKSNAIVFVKDYCTLGIGAGQMSRVDACKVAISKANSSLNNSVMASDGFFPFKDNIIEAASAGVSAIISPGGSIRDEEVVNTADELGIAMIFTGMRHFKH